MEADVQTKTGSGSVSEFMGQAVSPAIDYSFEFSVYENLTEAKASENWPSDNEILKWVNQTSERSAKASAYQKAIADLKKTYENSPAYKLAQAVKTLTALGYSQAEAEAIAQAKTAA